MNIKLRPDKEIIVEKKKFGNVPVLILRPRDAQPLPVGVLWIHGGGYITGLKEMVYMSRAADLVKTFGVTAVSPGYRLAFNKPYPAAFDDCYEALEYMHQHSDELGIRHLIVGGESAGGGLAAAVCMKARDRGDISIDYQLPLYPMLSNLDTETSANNSGKIWNTKRNHFGWKMYLRKDAKAAVSPYAAPAGQTDYHGLPPCYTFVGDGEPFYAETLDYVKNLQTAGIKAEFDVYHTNYHAFDMLRPKDEPGKSAILRFSEVFGEILESMNLEV